MHQWMLCNVLKYNSALLYVHNKLQPPDFEFYCFAYTVDRLHVRFYPQVLSISTSRICLNAHKTMAPSRGWQWDRNVVIL